jgi:hypothetical protein
MGGGNLWDRIQVAYAKFDSKDYVRGFREKARMLGQVKGTYRRPWRYFLSEIHTDSLTDYYPITHQSKKVAHVLGKKSGGTYTTIKDKVVKYDSIWNPEEIYFTQNTISPTHDGGYTVEGNIEALLAGDLTPYDLEPIRIFVKDSTMDEWKPMKNPHRSEDIFGYPKNLEDGKIYSLDNRRLYEYKKAGITKIPVVWVTKRGSIKHERYKFTTENFGESVKVLPMRK